MYILFFIVHLFFAGAFYFLWGTLEAILFLILGAVSFFFFSPFEFWKNNQDGGVAALSVGNIQQTISQSTKTFFSQYSLVVALLMFYGSLFGGVYGLSDILGFWMGNFLVGLTISISLAYLAMSFIKKPLSHFSSLIFEMNLILISIMCIMFFFFTTRQIGAFQSLSLFLIDGALLKYLWLNPHLNLSKTRVCFLWAWAVAFIAVYSVLLYFWGSIGVPTISSILLIYCIVSFEVAGSRHFLRVRDYFRAVSLFWVYAATLLLSFDLVFSKEYWDAIPLAVSLVFNVYIHQRFENYPSLLLSTGIPVVVYLSIFPQAVSFPGYLVHTAVLSLGLTFFGRMIRTKYRLDEYVFQSMAVLVLLSNTISYGWRIGINGILEISAIFLVFSIVFFVSYLQIRKQ